MAVNFRRWGVFSLVGVGGFVLQVGTIALLTRVFGWSPLIATAVGLELAAFHNFIGHNKLTWKDRPARSIREWIDRYVKYQITKTTTIGASFTMTLLVIAATPLAPEIANTIAVLACALPNYLLTERLVFTAAGSLSANTPLTAAVSKQRPANDGHSDQKSGTDKSRSERILGVCR
jgi:putative flippase GtrA